MMKRFGMMAMSMFLGLALAITVYAKDGVDPDKKIVNLAGYDACTGKYGDYGLGDKQGQEVAVEEINNNGGIQAGPLKGYKLKLTFFGGQTGS